MGKKQTMGKKHIRRVAFLLALGMWGMAWMGCEKEPTSPPPAPEEVAPPGGTRRNPSEGKRSRPRGEKPKPHEKFSPNAGRLLYYLEDIYGRQMLSGQMDVAWASNASFDMVARVFADTGKYPAIKGFDFMQLPFDFNMYGYGQQQIDEAIEWWEGKNNGIQLLPEKPEVRGIVTFCWHWRAGPHKEEPNQESFRVWLWDETERRSFQNPFHIPWENGSWDKQSPYYAEIMEDLEKVAALLQQLKERDIPVLWRPLHEAGGNYADGSDAWFWWGASGPEAYKALWELMYDYFTNTKGLDNLIWVWNGEQASYFPEPSTVDIAGYDYYSPYTRTQPVEGYSSFEEPFRKALEMVPGKNRMLALTENGAMPDPQQCLEDNALWLWFMTWNDSNLDGTAPSANFWSGEFHNTQAHKTWVYNHPAVVTLDKLPDLTQYPR